MLSMTDKGRGKAVRQ